MKRSKLLFLLPFLLIPAGSVFSQTPTGGIKGLLTDTHGAVIPSIAVMAKSKAKDGAVKTAYSNYDGLYEIRDLSPGTYEVSAESFGMMYRNENVVVKSSETTELNAALSYEAACSPDSAGKILELTDSDRKEIISSILEDSLSPRKIPDYSLLARQKGPLVLSLETIRADWVKQPANVDLVLMSEKEIKNKANKSGDFLYLSFSNWKIGGNCVVVMLSNTWMAADNSGMVYLSGGGNYYLYQKENGKWMGKVLGSWIS